MTKKSLQSFKRQNDRHLKKCYVIGEWVYFLVKDIQSSLVISKSKGPSETLRDIRTSTYQMYRIEENTNRTNKFNK